MSAQIAEDLRAAAAYIEEHGWFRLGAKRYDEGGDAACILVSVTKVTRTQRYAEHWAALRQHLGLTFVVSDLPEAPLAKWNDDPSRTKEDVIKALLQAADAVEVQP